jgi:hypothetical protein
MLRVNCRFSDHWYRRAAGPPAGFPPARDDSASTLPRPTRAPAADQGVRLTISSWKCLVRACHEISIPNVGRQSRPRTRFPARPTGWSWKALPRGDPGQDWLPQMPLLFHDRHLFAGRYTSDFAIVEGRFVFHWAELPGLPDTKVRSPDLVPTIPVKPGNRIGLRFRPPTSGKLAGRGRADSAVCFLTRSR